MTQFKYTCLEAKINGSDVPVKIIPKEYLEVHARFIWENEGRPGGKHNEHWKKAKDFFTGCIVIPTEEYILLEGKYKGVNLYDNL